MSRAAAEARALLGRALPLMTAPPVKLVTICEALGIEIYSQPCDSFGALCVFREERRVLMVNEAMNLGRKRFSIAHELGHVVLGHVPFLELAGLGQNWGLDQEREANRFAAELLMPGFLMEREPEGASVGLLARRYAVSKQAMSIRV